jgi:molybdate transport system ATP-binding protein
MNLLAGLLKPDRGRLCLNETVLFDGAAGINLTPEQRRVGVVFQQACLFPHLSVKRNLLYGYRRIPQSKRMIDPATLIEVLSLGPLLARNVHALSGGERQRVALGRTVLACPQLVLLDEPLTGLDAGLKYQIIPYLKSVFSEFSIPMIFISHSLNEMRLMTDTVLEFAQGQLLGQTSAEELARSRLGTGQDSYQNLLQLAAPRIEDGLYIYRWGDQPLTLTSDSADGEHIFQLAATDITLFRDRPTATSARNLLLCRVVKLFGSGNRVGVELDCGGQRLVSQVVKDAARDLQLKAGSEVFAVVKASAIKRLN